MNDVLEKPKRPLSITLISLFMIIGGGGDLIFSFLGLTRLQLGIWFLLYEVLFLTGLLVCGIGLWLLKKWAVYVFAGLSVIAQIVILISAILLEKMSF